jgi:hypothetical protein
MSRKSPQSPRIAIVSLTKNPVDFSSWLDYHIDVVGISHIFLQVEDTPSIELLIQSSPKYSKIISLNPLHSSEVIENQYVELQHRQAAFINRSIESARTMQPPMDFILHIDDDELLYVSQEYKHSLPVLIQKQGYLDPSKTKASDFHFKNIEAVYMGSRTGTGSGCFTTNKFKDCSTSSCRSYANGKSMGRITGNPDLVSWGPHHFSGETMDIPSEKAMVLHFDSCCFERWKSKFINLSAIQDDDFEKIPFRYYKESIQRLRSCDVGCPNCGEDVWQKWTNLQHPEDFDIELSSLPTLTYPNSGI